MNQLTSSSQVWHFHRQPALAAHCTVTKPATSPRWALCLDVQGEISVEWFDTREAALETASAIASVLLTHGWSPRTPEEAPRQPTPVIGAGLSQHVARHSIASSTPAAV